MRSTIKSLFRSLLCCMDACSSPDLVRACSMHAHAHPRLCCLHDRHVQAAMPQGHHMRRQWHARCCMHLLSCLCCPSGSPSHPASAGAPSASSPAQAAVVPRSPSPSKSSSPFARVNHVAGAHSVSQELPAVTGAWSASVSSQAAKPAVQPLSRSAQSTGGGAPRRHTCLMSRQRIPAEPPASLGGPCYVLCHPWHMATCLVFLWLFSLFTHTVEHLSAR